MRHFIRPNGWIAVSYSGPENAKVEIGIGGKTADKATWYPAFFDYDSNSGDRIVCIPRPEWTKSTAVISFGVFLRINGQVQR